MEECKPLAGGRQLSFAGVVLVKPRVTPDGTLGTGCAVVDEVGEVGEVVVLGHGVAAGYLTDPAARGEVAGGGGGDGDGGDGLRGAGPLVLKRRTVAAGEWATDDDRFPTLGSLIGDERAGGNRRRRAHRTGDLARWSRQELSDTARQVIDTDLNRRFLSQTASYDSR